MFFKNYYLKIFFSFLIILSCLIILTNCSIPKFAKPSKTTKDNPINAKERARKNIDDGRGASLKDLVGRGNRSTTYQFSTSNPLWRSSLEILDFLPLATVDYSGGIIITDWYNDSQNSNESLKITVRFLSNEISSNSVKVIVHSKNCSALNNCKVTVRKSKISEELTSSILNKASLLDQEMKKKKKKKKKKN